MHFLNFLKLGIVLGTMMGTESATSKDPHHCMRWGYKPKHIFRRFPKYVLTHFLGSVFHTRNQRGGQIFKKKAYKVLKIKILMRKTVVKTHIGLYDASSLKAAKLKACNILAINYVETT